MRSHFLWPKVSIGYGLSSAYRLTSVSRIEEKLQVMFPSGYPVLCTSGRSALYMALIQAGVSRMDSVGIFPYASHCVLDAVSRVGTPLTGPTALNSKYRLLYHQWGYVQEQNAPANVIEDCVDTLCIPGTELFPGGGAFEIWSLPKILGTTSGGVLWCRDEKVANHIRAERDRKSGDLFQWFIRLVGYNNHRINDYWQGAESRIRKVTRLQTGEIWNSLQNWHNIVSDRLVKLDYVWPHAVDWLEKPISRLPTVVPLARTVPESELFKMGLSAGYRMIERIDLNGDRKLIKVVPIPIHQDVSEKELIKFIEFFQISH